MQEDIVIDLAPEDEASRRRMPRWPLVLGGILLAIGIAIAALWPVKVPYYTLSPGPVYDTSDFVHVTEGNLEDDGELFFLTVSLKEANVFEYIGARLDPTVDISPRENIRPPDVSPEQLRRENLALMEESKTDAMFVALTELGYEPTYIGTGALVIETVPDSAADGVLLADDVIVEMEGQPIQFRSDVIDLLAGREIGDEIHVVVERVPADGGEEEVVELDVVLGPHTEDPERPMIGILLDNNTPIVEFPVDIKIDSQNIGGPSAGMMFTLQIVDQLTDEPLTKGYRIAGTGTIDRDGTVGAIGGVKQKVFAAIDAGAYAVLVPAANYKDAADAGGDDIVVVSITTIDDALAFLESLPGV